MEWRFPYFYYDVFARVVPGVALLVAGANAGFPMPPLWRPLLVPAAPSGQAAAVPGEWAFVTIAGVSILAVAYAIGVVFEAVAGPCVWDRGSEWMLRRAAWHQNKHLCGLYPPPGARPSPQERLSYAVWGWLNGSSHEDAVRAIPHGHRFQAEARMSLFLIPSILIAGATAACHKQWTMVVFWAVVCAFAGFTAWQREQRRWRHALRTLYAAAALADPATEHVRGKLRTLDTRPPSPGRVPSLRSRESDSGSPCLWRLKKPPDDGVCWSE